MITETPDASPSHPEEIKAVFEMRFGTSAWLKGSARCTPAGVVAAGIATSLILLAVSTMIRAAHSGRR